MKNKYTPIEVITAKIISKVEERKAPLRSVMEEYFIANPQESVVRGVVRAYAISVFKKYRLIDTIIKDILNIDPYKLDIFEKNLLRSLVYEIKFRKINNKRILKIGKRLKSIQLSKKDINSIRNLPVKEILSNYRGIERIGIEYSLPDWIVEYLINLLGKPEAFKLFKKFNKKQDIWIRTNTMLIKPSQLIKRLKKKGVILEKDNLFHEIFRVIESKRNLTHLEEYKRGLFYIQDKSSLLTGHAINAKTWDYVWDMCSAPGGKSSHLYQIFKGKINIIATDWKIQRIKTMKNILERLRINNIPLIVTNSVFPPFNRKFDKIIIDPDCSSLGRLGQSPEIRLWLTKDMILNFQKNQRKLIEISTDYLKKNGTLIYSTCTLTLEENEENVIWALNNFPFILEPIDIELGLNGLKGLNYTRRLYPHIHSTTGFFIAKLRYQ